MDRTIVDDMHEKFRGISVALMDADATLCIYAEEYFRKSLLLAAASYFEVQLKQSVREFSEEVLPFDGHPLAELINNRVIERQYHTWFDWKARNANTFFRPFGKNFKNYAEDVVMSDEKIERSIQNFLEIGIERNRLVHENFAGFSLEKTSEEIYGLYRGAKEFVDWVPINLREFCAHRLSDR